MGGGSAAAEIEAAVDAAIARAGYELGGPPWPDPDGVAIVRDLLVEAATAAWDERPEDYEASLRQVSLLALTEVLRRQGESNFALTLHREDVEATFARIRARLPDLWPLFVEPGVERVVTGPLPDPWSAVTAASFENARDLAKQLLTLATALLTLSVAFYKDVLDTPLDTPSSVLLVATWIVCFASIVFGVLALATLTGAATSHDGEGRAKPDWTPNINTVANRQWAIAQMACFGAGVLGLTVLGIVSLP
jgi:hypothetical protein